MRLLSTTELMRLTRMELCDGGEEGVPAFTVFGIKCLEEIIAIERAAGRAPPKVRPPK
jgi:hypothetical protein